jgi:thiosulfate/3-mercaptopyruvate sulfurtransferase
VTDHGRHPLPTPEALIALFSRLGIDAKQQVVTYDHVGGAFAARLWWQLRYMGHEAVAVLDGGWAAWVASGQAVRAGVELPEALPFAGRPALHQRVLLAEVRAGVPLLVDARAPARYRGDEEPMDPRAGHIPGALNHFFRLNLDESGHFLAPAALREGLERSLGGRSLTEDPVFYCGSGVTACHNILAAVQAGMALPRLYAGSWSEWSRNPALPVAVGPAPGG